MDNEKKEFENEVLEASEEMVAEVEEVIEFEEGTEAEDAEEIDEVQEEYTETAGEENVSEEAVYEDADFEGTEDVEAVYGDDEIAAPKKNNKPLFIILGVVAALVIAAIVYIFCYTSGVGTKNVVNTLPPDEVSQEGEIVKAEKMNIKFENPVISLAAGKAGTSVSAMKVGNFGITSDVFNYFVKNEALTYEFKLYQNKKIPDVSKFDWNAVGDEESGLTHTDIVKIKAVRSATPILAIIAEANKRGLQLTEEEVKEITDNVEKIKEHYGDGLEEALKGSGFENLDQYVNVQKIQRMYEKAFNAFHEDPTSYVKGFENVAEVMSDDKITVKHILLTFPEGVTKESDAEAKAETLKKAEEVLAKAKAGDDFDALIEEYNQDPGQGKNGYTFSNDGTMVQEFADAAFKLEIDKISEIVETSYGYHIIKRTERIADFDEYTELLVNNSSVKVNRKIYEELPVNVNLADFIGDTAAQG